MKATKTDWRSCLSSTRLSDLMMISIHSDPIEEFDPLPAFNLWRERPEGQNRRARRPNIKYPKSKRATVVDVDMEEGDDVDAETEDRDSDTDTTTTTATSDAADIDSD